ncbi:L-rhamnose mutarotase [Paraburkholderia bannensis]|uniref:L-rhamnose mutarotase n=1 Tax=Paraburkholderia bannensis TaxID=765414 RepID=UPI002ABDB64E|nr:L-rhamnose mutarotase [Paraburkholderia bannensis]
METVAFRMQLDPGKRDEYERRHREIWPELASALRDAGVNDYWIFLDESTHALFAVLKRRDDHQMDRLPETAIMRKWWDYMADIMATGEGNVPVTQPLVPVFHLL